MRVVITSFAARCLDNWIPLAHEIRAQGDLCDIALFPRVSDPSNQSLLHFREYILFNEPIGADFGFISNNGELTKLCKKLSDYDLILLASCIAGPELMIRKELRRQSSQAKIIGLQHGFYQLWDTYAKHWESFDFFGVFGQAFVERFPKPIQERVIPLGLPKLDLIKPTLRMNAKTILFCLQTTTPLEVIMLIARELTQEGFQIIFRGHPEFPEQYSYLRSAGFSFVDPGSTLLESLQNVGYVVTTGSTVVLEALQLGLPVAVIPEQAGSEYKPFKIVTESSTGAAIINVLRNYNDEKFRQHLHWQLQQHSGPATGRSLHAYTALKQILYNK